MVDSSSAFHIISYNTLEEKEFENRLAENIREKLGEDAKYLLDYPVVYLHVWQNAEDKRKKQYSIYIGEANNIISRTKEHLRVANSKNKKEEGKWQHHLVDDTDEANEKVTPTLYVLGHECFNKSFTMDIENSLIDFCLAIDTAHLMNGRGNPQSKYYDDSKFENMFRSVWAELRTCQPNLFIEDLNEIKNSAIYKISPNHKLTDDQLAAKEMIMEKISEALLESDLDPNEKQLIMVKGDAGTGKTVLTSSIFFDLLDKERREKYHFYDTKIKPILLIRHDEQEKSYKILAKKLGCSNPNEIIQNPTSFLSTPSPENQANVVFVDEAHLLWTQKVQHYGKNITKDGNQLNDIMSRAKITVIMFDENQILDSRSYVQMEEIKKLRAEAKSKNRYVELNYQLRMNCGQKAMSWLNSLTQDLTIGHLKLENLGKEDKEYEIKLFNTPRELEEAIIEKSKTPGYEISRLLATYDWPFAKRKKSATPKQYYEVKIGDWHLPWNYQLKPSKREGMDIANHAWAEQKHTIGEVGSIFTIQGFDLAYAGVIIGPSVSFNKETGKIVFKPNEKCSDHMKGNRTMCDGSKRDISDEVASHELRVLLTRGTNGLYIYACDPDLREELFKATNNP